MTKKPSRVRVLMMPYQDDDDRGPVGYSGPATVLTGLPRTIRRHELRLIVPLADSTSAATSLAASISRRDAWCGIWRRSKLGWSTAARPISKGERRSPAPDVHLRKTRPVSPTDG